jgi:hypothetical protein
MNYSYCSTSVEMLQPERQGMHPHPPASVVLAYFVQNAKSCIRIYNIKFCRSFQAQRGVAL